MSASWTLSLFLCAPLAGAAGPAQDAESAPETLWIRAERVIVRPGVELERATLRIEEGVIVAVGEDLTVPEGAEVVEAPVACAGFIDPWSAVGLDRSSAEDRGTVASTRTVDALDPFRRPHERTEALQAGVTSARVQAGRLSMVGGVGAVVSVDPSTDSAVLLEDACVSATVGVTRGGGSADVFDRIAEVGRLVGLVKKGESYRREQLDYRDELAEWEEAIAEKREELEDDFKKAKKKRDKEIEEAEEDGKEFKEDKYKEDKKPKQPRWDPNLEVMARVADGELPIVVEVHRVPELRGLLEDTEDLDRLRMIVAGATEAAHLAEQLADRDISVLLWPTPEVTGRSEYARHDLALAGELERAGVEVLLGSGGRAHARDLRLLAALAVGHGLDAEAALHAITLGPARAFDVADRVGSLERGKVADVLLFDGDPLDTTARLQHVVSRGRVVER